MTILKTSALSLSLVGTFALGVWTAPYFTPATTTKTAIAAPQVDQVSTSVSAPAPRAKAGATRARVELSALAPTLAVSDEPVQAHAKSLLNSGTDVKMASEGFRDATEFVTAAYAARNTAIPFMLLKHRVLTEGLTLSEAIRASKPELDAVREMDRARTAARSDLSRLSN
jgi:hypothetical protein